MSRAAVVATLLALSVTFAAANDCTALTPDNETASLNYFSANLTINGSKVSIAPCDELQKFEGCGSTAGYIATYNDDGTCRTVYNKKDSITYNDTAKQFRTRYYTDDTQNRFFDAVKELIVVVKCLMSASPAYGTREGNVITIRTETVCAGYPFPTPAPAPPTEDEGLSTGAIVGIVIGALAILIIVLVIFRWKSQKGEEEGEYQRV